MVRGDIQQNGDVGTEVVHIVQLEGAEFDDVVFMRILGNLKSQGISDITSQTCIITSRFEDMVDKAGSGRLTV